MSIIRTNNIDVFSHIKQLIYHPESQDDLNELRKLWKTLGIELTGCQWRIHGDFINYDHVDSGRIVITPPTYSRDARRWDLEITKKDMAVCEFLPNIKEKDYNEWLNRLSKFIIRGRNTIDGHYLANFKH